MNFRFSILLLMISLPFLIISCSSDTKTLSANPSKLDFDGVDIGDSVDKEIVLTNKYGKAILISGILLSGSTDYSITSGGSVPVTLENKATLTIEIKFEPTTAGELVAELAITHEASTKDKLISITGSGRLVPRIELSENSYDYGKKYINKDNNHDFTIENIGTSDLIISNFNLTGTDPGMFSITAGGTTPVTITPGTQHQFTLTFKPTSINTFSADLNIGHNAVNETNPITVPITGIGIDKDPQITLNQTSPWDFGTVATTLPCKQVLEIENTGTDPLTVSSAVLTNKVEFTIDSLEDMNGNIISFPCQIDVGKKVFLMINFAPSSKTTFNDTLTIEHDGTNESTPWAIAIEGTGRDEITKTFVYTGAVQQFQLPAGTTTLKVEVHGAEGGIGQRSTSYANPGKGGLVTATVYVSPGALLNVYVGGKGGNATAGVSSYGTGGWNGGGKGAQWSGGGGGGGGGGSDIRENGTDLTDRIVVAGGGGGSGCNSSTGEYGGDGGGLNGQDGYASNNPTNYHGYGGTQTQGGNHGGDSGIGGNGGFYPTPGSQTGGGGGGGYYGGGGSTWEGAGGGSSYAPTNATNVTHTQGTRSGDGEIKITY